MAQRPVPDADNPPPRRNNPAVQTERAERQRINHPSDAAPLSGDSDELPPEIIYVGRREAHIKRAGCGCAVIAWSLIMLLPLALFILAAQGEIALWHGDRIPDASAHPMLQVRLLSEIRSQGLVITTSSLAHQSQQDGEARACVQTHVRYLMWEGEGQDASYCDCYARPAESDANADWQYLGTSLDTCEATP